MSIHKKPTMAELVDQHDNSLYGTWNEDLTKRNYGLVEQIAQIRMVLLYLVGPLVTISALSALGVPLKFAVPLVEKFIIGFVQR